MTLDIRGSLKNTRLSKNPYVVFEELFSNAIDSFLIRKNTDAKAAGLEVSFVVDIRPTDLMGEQFDLTVNCKDNGSGFGEEQTEAFLTKDTSYKDDLAIIGIGQCKGAGRIQFFHHFGHIEILSGFDADGKRYKRTLNYHEGQKQIDLADFPAAEDSAIKLGTQIRLEGLRQNVRSRIFSNRDISYLFGAKPLKNHLLVTFMRRLVGLRNELGAFSVAITVNTFDKERRSTSQLESFGDADIPDATTMCCVKVYEIDRSTWSPSTNFKTLTLSYYRLSAKEYDLPSNAIALCAKASPVKSITDRYLRPKAVENNPLNGSYHVLMIEGDFLDGKVNEQRDDFDIPSTLTDGDLFASDQISLEQIFAAVDDVIDQFVTPPDWSKESIVQTIGDKFGITESMGIIYVTYGGIGAI